MWLVVANLLVSESFVLTAVHVVQVMMFLQTSNKANVLCFSTFYLCMNGKVIFFIGQSFKNGLSCVCQAIGNILNLYQK